MAHCPIMQYVHNNYSYIAKTNRKPLVTMLSCCVSVVRLHCNLTQMDYDGLEYKVSFNVLLVKRVVCA